MGKYMWGETHLLSQWMVCMYLVIQVGGLIFLYLRVRFSQVILTSNRGFRFPWTFCSPRWPPCHLDAQDRPKMKVPRDVDGLDDSMRSKFVGSWVWVLVDGAGWRCQVLWRCQDDVFFSYQVGWYSFFKWTPNRGDRKGSFCLAKWQWSSGSAFHLYLLLFEVQFLGFFNFFRFWEGNTPQN